MRVLIATAGARGDVAPFNPPYRKQAEVLSRQLASEDGAAPIISMLARLGGG